MNDRRCLLWKPQRVSFVSIITAYELPALVLDPPIPAQLRSIRERERSPSPLLHRSRHARSLCSEVEQRNGKLSRWSDNGINFARQKRVDVVRARRIVSHPSQAPRSAPKSTSKSSLHRESNEIMARAAANEERRKINENLRAVCCER